MAGWTGLEPATFRVTGGRSIRAELPPHNIKNQILLRSSSYEEQAIRPLKKWPAIRSLAESTPKLYAKEWRSMAPRAGIEPATQRLTVVCSTSELPRNKKFQLMKFRLILQQVQDERINKIYFYKIYL